MKGKECSTINAQCSIFKDRVIGCRTLILNGSKALPGIVYPGGPGYDSLCIIDLAW
jgi:hypothetical protein